MIDSKCHLSGPGAACDGGVLVGPVHAVRVPVAHPLPRYAHRTVPQLHHGNIKLT